MKTNRPWIPLLLAITLFGDAALFADRFESRWSLSPDRRWVGSGLWANRLQDWQVANGRLECVEGRAGKPMRTVHLASHVLGEKPGDFSMSVETGVLLPHTDTSLYAVTGFLLGAGEGLLDPRAASLVHHSSGPGAGIFAGVDLTGQVFFHDFAEGPIPLQDPPGMVPRARWRLHYTDSFEPGSEATRAFDWNPNTIWHTEWQVKKPPHPHELQIDMAKIHRIKGFRYLPRQDSEVGRISGYEFFVSNDGERWSGPVASGNFPNSKTEQEVTFPATEARFVRLSALGSHGGRPTTTVAEFHVMSEAPEEVATGDSLWNFQERSLVLELDARRVAGAYALDLVAREKDTGLLLSRTSVSKVGDYRMRGPVALVSHPGSGLRPGRFWFRNWQVAGDRLEARPNDAPGAILATQYTLSDQVLKLTAQLMPLGASDNQKVRLEVRDGDEEEPQRGKIRNLFRRRKAPDSVWRQVAEAKVVAPGWTATFRVPDWDDTQVVPYRVVYDLLEEGRSVPHEWAGTIQANPTHKRSVVVAGFTGNHNVRGGVDRGSFEWTTNAVWFPHNDVVAAVQSQKPDLLFFSGDQVYEGASPTAPEKEPEATAVLDYLYKWYLYCWAFRDLTRDLPTVTIPDDHDVFQGNIWGAGGRATQKDDQGGYVMPASWVRMVERTQTSHLPDPHDSQPVGQGIGTYYTGLKWGRVGFAVIEDRKFKSGPSGLVPSTTSGRADHVVDPDFDPQTADVKGATLLGDRQLKFLEEWAADWRGTEMKAVLSQTVFANLATHHGGNLQYLVADYDSNGWPQSGRAKALERMRRGFAFMLGGDQHLATVVHHGIDDWNDAGWSFAVPSIANFYPRSWDPPRTGNNRPEGAPPNMGEHVDGFGNKVTVVAATNPGPDMKHLPKALHDRMPGYGIVRFDKVERTITMECWPRFADPKNPAAGGQYPGWPVTVTQLDNYGAATKGHLPEIRIVGLPQPVVQVIREDTGEMVYSWRMPGLSWRPVVFNGDTRYTVKVGEPERDLWVTREGIGLDSAGNQVLEIQFEP